MADVSNTAVSTPWYQSLADSLAKVGTAYVSVEQQKQLNDINLQRARQGLPPLDTSQYQTGVNVGVSASTRNTLVLIAGGVAAVWLLTSILKHRR